jgi:hypothetical protein
MQAKFHYPQESRVFILDSEGLQAFVLAVSSKPLPPYKEWRSKVESIPWKGVKDGPVGRWQFDEKKSFTRFQIERGRLQSKDDIPESFQKLCRFFKSRPEFDVIQAVAFTVSKDQK